MHTSSGLPAWTRHIFAALVLLALPPPAFATISDGAAAIDLLGQYGDSLTDPQPVYTKYAVNNGANKLGFREPNAVAVDSTHHRLFVVDTFNNRVLVYVLNADGTLPDRIPDNVLGQGTFHANGAGAFSQSGMSFPQGVAYDGVNDRLFVSHFTANKVLVYDVSSITDGENAVHVLGQADFSTVAGRATQDGLSRPMGMAYDAGNARLFVADQKNNRVLAYDVSSITDGEDAAFVLGQSTFTASGATTTQAGLRDPLHVAYDAGSQRVFVADNGNNRVLAFDASSLSNGMNAANVLGQPDFVSSAGASTQATLNAPRGLASDDAGHRLFVASSNRVTVYDVASITDGENAINVLGQATFTSLTPANTQAGMGAPQGVAYDPGGNRLYVAQSHNNRVSVFDVASITDGENAADLLGQYDASATDPQPVFTKYAVHDGANRLGFSYSISVGQPTIDTVSHRLYVPDAGNHRVLVYDLSASGTLVDRIPDNVLGQANLYSNAAANTQAGMKTPVATALNGDGSKLFVAQSGNHRVTVYDVASITDGESATNVIGQADFTGKSAANTQAGLNTPQGVAYDGVRDILFVSQSLGNRVTAYTGSTIANGMNAAKVLGQSTFTASAAANTQAGMKSPVGLAYDATNNRLFVVQSGNNRVSVFTLGTFDDGMNAANVLGQGNFTSFAASTTQNTLNLPYGAAFDGANQRLFVSDVGNSRLLAFDVASITDGENAINVLGQADFTTNGAIGFTQANLVQPRAMAYDGMNQRLYVQQSAANRISVFDVAP